MRVRRNAVMVVFAAGVAIAVLTLVWAGCRAGAVTPACPPQTPGVCPGVDLTNVRLTDLPPDVLAGDFRLSPPPLTRLTARAAASGQTWLRATFAQDQRLRTLLALSGPRGSVTFHDDGQDGDDRAGDGIYAATLPLPFTTVAANQQSLVAVLDALKVQDFPMFAGRAQSGRIPLQRFTGGATGEVEVLPARIFGRLIHADRSLFITDPAVVGDPARAFDPCAGTGTPDGVWTFSHLMTEMANHTATGLDPEAMTRSWFNLWKAAEFSAMTDDWPATTDLAHAPFRLVAIVNRPDLATNLSGYGGAGAGNGGEGRFIFELCAGPPRMVIVEYGIDAATCSAVRGWERRWVGLNTLTPGSDAYNAALQSITETFVARGAAPGKPNGSALNQIRTDARLEGGNAETWRMHEWHMQADGQAPTQVEVAQTPDRSFNGTTDLASWINLEQSAILAGTHQVGHFFTPIDASRLFRGLLAVPEVHRAGSVVTSASHWHAPGITSNDARQAFSLAACDGCHTGETGTNFRHDGVGIPLSGFLTGIDVPDPEVPSTVHHFAELDRRAGVLAQLATGACLDADLPSVPLFVPPFDPRLPHVQPVMPPIPPLDYRPTITSD